MTTQWPPSLTQCCQHQGWRPFVMSWLDPPKRFHSKDLLRISPLEKAARPFVDALLAIDKAGYGQYGMPMPNWVFFDCGAMPGLVTGFCLHRSRLDNQHQQFFAGIESEWYPISMFIIIPTIQPGTWFAHNLVSINAKLKGRWPKLALFSKALGLELSQCHQLIGATQWNSPALSLHTSWGPIQILDQSAINHGTPNTLVYKALIKDPWTLGLINHCPAEARLFEPSSPPGIDISLGQFLYLGRDGDKQLKYWVTTSPFEN